jgi:hypothetical protein
MIGHNRLIDISFSPREVALTSFGNLNNKDKKAEPRPVHAFEGESLPDTAFPPPEYFIDVMEQAALPGYLIKSKRRLIDDIANLNVCLRCASGK